MKRRLRWTYPPIPSLASNCARILPMGIRGMRLILIGGAAWLALVLPPASASATDQIAYDCDFDICTVDPGSGTVMNLTQTPTLSERSPSWSPDDTRIAYIGNCSSGVTDLCTVSVANPTSSVNVSQTPDRNEDVPQAPVWSPDSTLLAYSATYNSNAPPNLGTDTFVSPASGTSQPVAYGSSMGYEAYPTFAPDGAHIAFERLPGSIYVATLDGSGAATFLPGSADSFMPSWSPDGTRIAAVWRVMPNVYAIRVIAASGSGGFTDLSTPTGDGSIPTWSPDSTKLAWVTPAGNVHAAPADGSNAGTDLVRAPGAGFAGNPVWSPDGTRIAYNAVDSNSHTQIYVVDAASGAPAVPVTSAGANNSEPSWKPAPFTPPVTPPPGTPPVTPPPGTPPVTPPVSPTPTPTRPAVISGFGGHGPINPYHLSVGIACNANGSLGTNPVCKVHGDGFTRSQTAPHRVLGRRRSSKVLVITGSTTVPAGQTKQLKFKVTKAGAKLLKTGRKLKTKVTIRVTQQGTKTVTATKTLKLQVPHKH